MNAPHILLVRELSIIDETSPLWNHPILPELDNNGFFSNLRFTFVGVYYSVNTDATLIGYPKYYPEHIADDDVPSVIAHVNLICQVVEQAQPYLEKSLFDSAYAFHEHTAETKGQTVNRYDLATFILRDYMTYGIYCNRKAQLTRSKNGPIQWQETIQRTTPVFDQDVIYLDTLHLHSERDYSQMVTQLHIEIVIQCARLLQGIGSYHDLELPTSEANFDNTNLSQFASYLLSQLIHIFLEREIRLVKALSAWCGQTLFYRNQMGVTTFDRIWEYASKKVFGNIEETRSGPPNYYIDNEVYQAHGGAIPDIMRVFIHPKMNCGVIGILDAKYYCIQLNTQDHIANGAPANADIAKQIGYLHYFEQLYPQNDIKFTNAFLLPSILDNQKTLFKPIGYISLNNKHYDKIDELLNIENDIPTSKQDRVLLYNVNPEALFNACLAGRGVDEETFYSQFVVPFYSV